MRKNINAKAYIYPLPVLVIGSYDENGTPNAMTAAWGTVADTNQVTVCISKGHKTMQNILKTGAFSLSPADAKNVTPADYVGIVSGYQVPNKIEKAGWTAQKGEWVNAPIFKELPLALECKLLSYDEDTEFLIGEVVNVSVDEGVLNEEGKLDLTKFNPLCYDTDGHDYYVLGERIANAFQEGKKLK